MPDTYLNADIGAAKHAFKTANCENIIALCEEYLSLLDKFRRELYEFQGKAEISLREANPALLEKVLDKRQEIRFALTEVVRELNQTNALLGWLTSARGGETIETFNRVRFRGHETWECRGGKVRFAGASEADEFPIQKAVDIAIGLRCGEFIDSFDIANDPERNLQESADSFVN